VYATCSPLVAENESVADAFSRAHPDFEPLPVGDLLDAANVPDAKGLTQANCLRLWPHRHATDGFFAAVWRRKV
jgi:16S rRNA (cytosine967-C5)-methyltransferase